MKYVAIIAFISLNLCAMEEKDGNLILNANKLTASIAAGQGTEVINKLGQTLFKRKHIQNKDDFYRPDMRPKRWSQLTHDQKMKKIWELCGPCCPIIVHTVVVCGAIAAYFKWCV